MAWQRMQLAVVGDGLDGSERTALMGSRNGR